MPLRGYSEEEIQAAYEGAEAMVASLVETEEFLLVDYRPDAKRASIRSIARRIADAVIRAQVEDGDITDLVKVSNYGRD